MVIKAGSGSIGTEDLFLVVYADVVFKGGSGSSKVLWSQKQALYSF